MRVIHILIIARISSAITVIQKIKSALLVSFSAAVFAFSLQIDISSMVTVVIPIDSSNVIYLNALSYHS